MADEQVLGVHYFDHQFLRQADFETAQNYHVDRLRQHNRLLHLPGIVQGLQATGTTNTMVVQVTPGRAVDETHHEVILRQTANPEAPPLLRVQTATGFQESEQHLTGTALTIDLASVPASLPPDNAVFITIRQGTKEISHSQDPGTTDNNTRLVERAVIEASTSSPLGAQLLLAQINRNTNGTIRNVDLTERVFAGAWLADGSVTANHIRNDTVTLEKLDPNVRSLIESEGVGDNAIRSAMIAEADDGRSGQDTDTGTGVKTGHLQNNAVTTEKLQNDAVTTEKVADNTLFYTKLKGEIFDAPVVTLSAGSTALVPIAPTGAFFFVAVHAVPQDPSAPDSKVDWHFVHRTRRIPPAEDQAVFVQNTGGTAVNVIIRAYVLAEP